MAKQRPIPLLVLVGVLSVASSAAAEPVVAQQGSSALGGYEIRAGGTFAWLAMSYVVKVGGYLGVGKHLSPLVEVGANALFGGAMDSISTPYAGGGPFIKLNLRAVTWLNPFVEIGLHVLAYKNDRGQREYLAGFNPSVRLGMEFLIDKIAGFRLAAGGDGYIDRERATGGFTLGEVGFVAHF